MIRIEEVTSKKGMKQFVKFPFSLYKNNKYWVPPIIKDELESLNKTINPVFETAQANFFLAYKGNKIVGRVAAIINWYEINQQSIKKMRFGWYDVEDDIEITKALLNKVKEIGKENNLEYIEGPVGFSNLDKVGVLTEGFDHIGTMITWYSMPYFKDHLEQLGYKKEKGYLENKFKFDAEVVKRSFRLSEVIKKRYKLRLQSFKSTKEIMPFADEMFDLFSKTYSTLSSYVPISDKQIEFFKKKYISFINPEYIHFVMDENNKMVGFGIVMPSFSNALQKAKGKLFPFGIYHLLKAKKHSKDVTFYLIGVDPEYQNKGVTAIIMEGFGKAFIEKGIINCIRTPELEENTAIHQLWKAFNPVTHKKRSTYRLNI